jgi:hypothetical protein
MFALGHRITDAAAPCARSRYCSGPAPTATGSPHRGGFAEPTDLTKTSHRLGKLAGNRDPTMTENSVARRSRDQPRW